MFTLQCFLCFAAAPGPCPPSAHTTSYEFDSSGTLLSRNSSRSKRKLVGSAISQLEIVALRACRQCWNSDVGDKVAGFKNGLSIRCVAGKQIELCNGNGPLAFSPCDMNRCIKRGKSNVLIGRIGRNTFVARSQYGHHAIVSANCRATTARLTFVAAVGRIAVVHAPGLLKKIPSRRTYIAELRRSAT